MKTEVLQIRISPSDKEKLKALAESSDMTMSEWIVNQIRLEDNKRER